MGLDDIVARLLGIVWSPALVGLCLLVGLYFSVRTRFIQLRGLPEMLKLMFQGRSSAAGVSSFQALSLSLSSRVGVGNIAGVAMAIAYGGPGAIFWMWIVAFLGASSAFVESTWRRSTSSATAMACTGVGRRITSRRAWASAGMRCCSRSVR